MLRLAYSNQHARLDAEKLKMHLPELARPSPLKLRGSLTLKVQLLLDEHPELAPFIETLVDELLKD